MDLCDLAAVLTLLIFIIPAKQVYVEKYYQTDLDAAADMYICATTVENKIDVIKGAERSPTEKFWYSVHKLLLRLSSCLRTLYKK